MAFYVACAFGAWGAFCAVGVTLMATEVVGRTIGSAMGLCEPFSLGRPIQPGPGLPPITTRYEWGPVCRNSAEHVRGGEGFRRVERWA